MDLCVCEEVAKEERAVRVDLDERRFGKHMTVLSGFAESVDLEGLASALKSALACGGTVTGGRIELQGDHTDRIGDLLRARGYAVE